MKRVREASASRVKCKRLRTSLVPKADASKASSGLRTVAHPAAAHSLSCGIRLSNGVVMPAVGYGTYKLKKGKMAKSAVSEALKAGYRLIDTAQVYDNEADVGAAIQASKVKRSDVFIETKVWRSSHGYESTMKACKQSLKKLGVDSIDLYMIHWPGCKTGWPLKRGTTCPKDWKPSMRDKGTWRAMEELYKEGKVKAIGVCNYSERHLAQLLKSCKVKPMVNQVEFHPHLVQAKLAAFCKKNGIALQAYASLGSGDAAQAEDFMALEPVVAAAKKHKKTPAQVLLRWAMEKGALVIPKSVKPHRMKENGGSVSFRLSKGEVDAISKLDRGQRYAWKGLDPDTIK